MRKLLFSLTILLLLVNTCISQTEADRKKAKKLGQKAVNLEDKEGKYDEAIALFKQAQQLDPSNITYPYEIAFAYYLRKDYKTAISLASELVDREDVIDEVFRVIGNSYDFLGNTDSAMTYYNKGLSIFPYSGKLYHEIGILQAGIDSGEQAIESWEKGVKFDPTYPSNYYALTKVFCNTSEKVWGVIYGELFLNIERNTDRSYEISKLLFDTYKDAININKDNTGKKTIDVSFSNIMLLNTEKKDLPFSTVYDNTIALSLIDINKINLKSLNSMRSNYIQLWYKMKNNEKYPNILFDWHKYLIEKGYFKAYNYWLFNNGNVEEFEKWGKDNYDEFKEFAEWFTKNPMKIDSGHYFVRTQY